MTLHARAPQGTEWNDVLDVLHSVTNSVMARHLYREGHPAIARADAAATVMLQSLLARLPEIVLALIDGELVVCERPMPELRKRLGTLATAMERLEIDCIVMQRGVTAEECTILGRTLGAVHNIVGSTKDLRDEARAQLPHVLFRYAQLRAVEQEKSEGNDALYFVPLVANVLDDVQSAIANDALIDQAPIVDLAARIVHACGEGLFALQPIAHAEGLDRLPAHSTNVAMMSASMAHAARLPDRLAVDVTAAALLHDVGWLLLPPNIRATPEPLLDDGSRALSRLHAYAGATVLLSAGCPPLWVTAALEHHRGVDGKGYPALASNAVPHPLVRLIALASFMASKQARYDGRGDDPETAFAQAVALCDRFFDAGDLRLFMRALGLFPPGTVVELSDRSVAIVTRANAADPERPEVRIIAGEAAGKRAELSSFHPLDDRHHLSIVGATAPPLMRRPSDDTRTVSAIRFATPIVEEAEITVIDPAPVIDVPISLRPSLVSPEWAARTSGTFAAQRDGASTPPGVSPLERLGGWDRVPTISMTPAEIAKRPLDPRAGFVLSLIDSMSTLETLSDMSGMNADELLRIVEQLVTMGIIELR
jgi:HD-GYP domain-containing protein (c-di-GMP phosphodiesterase class II)